MSVENHPNSESLSKTMRVFLLLATIVIITITIALILKKQPEISKQSLDQEIFTMQQQLPIRVDAYTELHGVELENMIIQYLFLINGGSAKQAGLDINNGSFSQQIETSIKSVVCQNKNTKRYINSGVSLSYHYVNEGHEPVAEFIVPAGFCK